MAQSLSPIIWVHCAGTDQLGAMSEIVARLRVHEPDITVHFTLPQGVAKDGHSATPFDVSDGIAVTDMLIEEAPDLVMHVGGPVEVALINQCRRMDIPLTLVNADPAALQRRNWLWRKTVLTPALREVDRAFVGSESAGTLWQNLGVRPWKTQVSPSLSEGYAAPPSNEAERQYYAEILAARPVWFIHKLPPAELAWAVAAIQTAQRSWPRMVTLIEPSKDLPWSDLSRACKDAGLIVHSQVQEGEPNELTQVFVTDGPDDVVLWYRLAALSYLGGTLAGRPCANPMLAASLGSAIVHGPRLVRHKSAFERLIAAGATTRVAHGAHLGDVIAEQLAPDRCAHHAHIGWEVLSEGSEMSNILMTYIAKTLDLELVD